MEGKRNYDDPGHGANGRFYDPDMNRAGIGEDESTLAEGISERKLMAKIDFRVVPVLTVMYLLAFLDRTNIGTSHVSKPVRLES